jgi:hypothetical protein
MHKTPGDFSRYFSEQPRKVDVLDEYVVQNIVAADRW